MKTKFICLLTMLALLACINQAAAHGTAFTYQGRLNNGGAVANGSYDLAFTLYTTNITGSAVAGPVTNSAVVVTNGLFTTLVDFGNAFTGTSNWLEAAVSTNGANNFMTLAPRQQLTPALYALFANTAGNVIGLSIQQNTDGSPNVIGGSSANYVSSGIIGATIAGGGATNYYGGNAVTANFGTLSGGSDNAASGNFSTVGGGYGNTASDDSATVGGGGGNQATNYNSTVGGGLFNFAGGYSATVGGGEENQASGGYSTVSGGQQNIAGGANSFAAGNNANATNDNSFVWNDGPAAFSSTTTNQFALHADGGVRLVTTSGVSIGTTSPDRPLSIQGVGAGGEWISLKNTNGDTKWHLNNSSGGLNFAQSGVADFRLFISTNGYVGIGNGTPSQLLVVGTAGAYCNGSSWVNGSDRNTKQAFDAINPAEVLAKVSAMPITEWQYKVEADGTKHIGPKAQDFHATFGLNGADDKHISTVDEGGVALAAIQGLNQKLEAQNASLKQQNDMLAERLNELEATVKSLATQK